jgi:molybdopterin molybdotransferase
MGLLSVDDALTRVLDGLVPLEPERVAIENAYGRVLAENLAARLTQPPFDSSAMDGYAVRAADVASLPAKLQVIGIATAGAGFKDRIGEGQAVRIFTGAPVPNGADKVVVQEDSEEADGVVTIREAAPHRHIRPRGLDFREGEVLLLAGTRLGARELLLAAAMSHAELPVRRKPRIAILATGDEVVPPGSELGPDQIVSSVPYGLTALIESEGGDAIRLGIAKDDPESLATLARAGRAADILVTIGGASVGERDLVASALKAEGLHLDFAKIAMRPGKPLLYGRKGSQRLLGLAGNPVSALISAHVFLKPMLRRMLGIVERPRPLPQAILGVALEANGRRQHYLRAISEWGADGMRVVRPLLSQDSSLVAELARADCLILREPDALALEAGAKVRIIPLD